jgi:hypothetical protein
MTPQQSSKLSPSSFTHLVCSSISPPICEHISLSSLVQGFDVVVAMQAKVYVAEIESREANHDGPMEASPQSKLFRRTAHLFILSHSVDGPVRLSGPWHLRSWGVAAQHEGQREEPLQIPGVPALQGKFMVFHTIHILTSLGLTSIFDSRAGSLVKQFRLQVFVAYFTAWALTADGTRCLK